MLFLIFLYANLNVVFYPSYFDCFYFCDSKMNVHAHCPWQMHIKLHFCISYSILDRVKAVPWLWGSIISSVPGRWISQLATAVPRLPLQMRRRRRGRSGTGGKGKENAGMHGRKDALLIWVFSIYNISTSKAMSSSPWCSHFLSTTPFLFRSLSATLICCSVLK